MKAEKLIIEMNRSLLNLTNCHWWSGTEVDSESPDRQRVV